MRASVEIPVAKDGSKFLPHLQRAGYYTVGPKGQEKRFQSYDEALAHLRNQPVAYWRRPNDSGNWGIVTAVTWIELID